MSSAKKGKTEPISSVSANPFLLNDTPISTKQHRNSYKRCKNKSRIKAQQKRDRYSAVMKELADLLPFEESLKHSFDKTTVLRLAINYMKTKDHFGVKGAPAGKSIVSKTPSTMSMALPHTSGRCQSFLSEADLKDLFMPAMGGFLVISCMNGIIAYISQNVQDYLGLYQHDMIGTSVLHYVHKDDVSEVKGALLMAGLIDPQAKHSFFCRVKCTVSKMPSGGAKSPGYRVIHCSGRVVIGKGSSVPSLVSVMSPVTPSAIVEVRMKPGVFTTFNSMNLKFVKVHMNNTVQNLFGYNPSDMVGRSMFEFHHVGDLPMCKKCHSELIVKGEGVSGYYRFLRQDGRWIWMQSRAAIVFDSKTAKANFIVITNYVVSESQALSQLALDGIDPNSSSTFSEFVPPDVPYPNDLPLDSSPGPSALSSIAHSPSTVHYSNGVQPSLFDFNQEEDEAARKTSDCSNYSTGSQEEQPARKCPISLPLFDSEIDSPQSIGQSPEENEAVGSLISDNMLKTLLAMTPNEWLEDLEPPQEIASPFPPVPAPAPLFSGLQTLNPMSICSSMAMPESNVASDLMDTNLALTGDGAFTQENQMDDLEDFLAEECKLVLHEMNLPSWAVVDEDPTGAPSLFSFRSS